MGTLKEYAIKKMGEHVAAKVVARVCKLNDGSLHIGDKITIHYELTIDLGKGAFKARTGIYATGKDDADV